MLDIFITSFDILHDSISLPKGINFTCVIRLNRLICAIQKFVHFYKKIFDYLTRCRVESRPRRGHSNQYTINTKYSGIRSFSNPIPGNVSTALPMISLLTQNYFPPMPRSPHSPNALNGLNGPKARAGWAWDVPRKGISLGTGVACLYLVQTRSKKKTLLTLFHNMTRGVSIPLEGIRERDVYL